MFKIFRITTSTSNRFIKFVHKRSNYIDGIGACSLVVFAVSSLLAMSIQFMSFLLPVAYIALTLFAMCMILEALVKIPLSLRCFMGYGFLYWFIVSLIIYFIASLLIHIDHITSVLDVNKINNLKHAWQFVLDTLDYPLDIMYLRNLNRIINETLMSDAGELRGYSVSIGGTSWKPDIPDYDKIREDLSSLMEIPCVTERAIMVMLYIMRTQMFSDGNKRVAQIAANQILIKDGKGYLKIPEDKITTFFDLLIKYYETNDSKEVAEFIYNTSIQGKIIVKKQDNPPIDESMFYNTKPDTTKHHPRR